ncbi:hypothetical protein OH77DRAFT_1384927, partial [Trametes cingulata]
FPPPPLTADLTRHIIEGFTKEVAMDNIIELPCAVCAQLTAKCGLLNLSEVSFDINL